MEKVIITNPMLGICHMAVCACKSATDEEILDLCNKENPAGTSGGWNTVHRDDSDNKLFFEGKTKPVQCEDYKDRLHILINC